MPTLWIKTCATVQLTVEEKRLFKNIAQERERQRKKGERKKEGKTYEKARGGEMCNCASSDAFLFDLHGAKQLDIQTDTTNDRMCCDVVELC